MAYWGCVGLLVSLTLVGPCLAADDATHYLQQSAEAYRHLKSFQVETATERIEHAEGKRVRLNVRITLYASLPDKLRVETKNTHDILQSVLISNAEKVIEYSPSKNEYSLFSGRGPAISFSPDRGVGLGEMVYDTIADGVTEADITGHQSLKLGGEEIPCAVITVEYGSRPAKFSFWIMEKKGLVLQRAVTYSKDGQLTTVVSTVRAITVNEEIPDSVFMLSPPSGAKLVRFLLAQHGVQHGDRN